MDKNSRSPIVVILVATILGIGFCLWKITQSPTPNEALLLSLFMTVLSVLVSWIISRFYAKASYEDNLKVFALKAAEKVTNLSNELDRLSAFLQKALDDEEFSSPNEELLAKSIRFEDAIHLITSLKSVNDTSLSDWRGIIGDELSAQKKAQLEEQEEREERLNEMMEKLALIDRESSQSNDGHEKEETERLRSELIALRGDLRLLAAQVGGVPLRTTTKKRITEKPCPRCSSIIQYQLRPKGTKKIDCPSCHARLYAQFDGAESLLRERVPTQESLSCPVCNSTETRQLDPLPGTMCEYECTNCQAQLRAIRTKRTITVSPRRSVLDSSVNQAKRELSDYTTGIAHEISPELLNQIEERMGPQPWPKGKSHEVRLDLGLSRYTIDYGIKQLISLGRFRPQVDGVLYEAVESEKDS